MADERVFSAEGGDPPPVADAPESRQSDHEAASLAGTGEASGAVDAEVAEAAPAAEASPSESDVAAPAAFSRPPESEPVPSDAGAPGDASPLDLPDLGRSQQESPESTAAIELLHDVDLMVEIELGRTRMRVADVLRLTSGSVVELDKLAGDPVDVYVNGRLIARGEVLVLNDTFCVRVNEIVTPPARAAG